MKSGLNDWRWQRISAVMIAVFAVPILTEWFCRCLITDFDWYRMLETDIGRVLTLCGLIGFSIHSYLGLRVVITDYVPRELQESALVLLVNWVGILFVYGLYLIWVF